MRKKFQINITPGQRCKIDKKKNWFTKILVRLYSSLGFPKGGVWDIRCLLEVNTFKGKSGKAGLDKGRSLTIMQIQQSPITWSSGFQ